MLDCLVLGHCRSTCDGARTPPTSTVISSQNPSRASLRAQLKERDLAHFIRAALFPLPLRPTIQSGFHDVCTPIAMFQSL